MDWEKKFNTILNDTKANLSRVKNKYDESSNMKNVTFAPTQYSTPMKRSNSLVDITPLSPSLYPQSSLHQSLRTDFYNPETTVQTFTYPSTQTLLEKLEQQNTAIEHLRSLIHRLETDRHTYKEQIRDLRNEIFQLTERTGNRRPDPSTERRIEHVRQEMLGEFQLLQSQVQMNTVKGGSNALSDTQLMSLNRDVLEIKHAFRDELEGFRRDVEILRSRLSKLELEFPGVRREAERRHNNLDRTMNTLTATEKQSSIPASALAMMNTNRQLEKLQINELKTALCALQGKIELLENSQKPLSGTTSKISPVSKPIFSNGFSSHFKSSQNGYHGNGLSGNDLLDDIDLSDAAISEDSDFAEFETEPEDFIQTKKHLSTPKKLLSSNNLDDDDLDLDDLDLSDADLSDNSLCEPLYTGDLT